MAHRAANRTPPRRAFELTLGGHLLAWLAAITTAAAWISGDDAARLAAALLLAPLLLDLLLKPRGLHLTAVQVGARRTIAGAPFGEEVRLRNEGRHRLREVLVHEPATNRLGAHGLVDDLRPGQTLVVRLQARCPHRGHARERTFALVTGWPLGLWRRHVRVTVAADLVTEPARVPVRAADAPALDEHAPAAATQRAAAGLEFYSLRELAPDESVRGVHALRSAATGVLLQRVHQGRLPRDHALVVDLRRPVGQRAVPSARRFEAALGAAATLTERLLAQGARVRATVLAADVRTFDVDAPAARLAFFTALAEAAPVPHRPLPAEFAAALRRGGPCYWFAAGGPHNRDEHAQLGTTLVLGEEA